MQDDFSTNNPKSIWQNQPTEASVMTLEKIREKAQELHTKTRRTLLGYIAAPLCVIFFYAIGLSQFPSLQALLQPLFALALVWSVAGLFVLNRGMWSDTLPADAGFNTGLEFCQREIERRTYLLRRVLLWSFAPVLASIGLFILALAIAGGREKPILPNGIPFLLLVVFWIVAYFLVRLKEQRKLQDEIVTLKAFEKQKGR